MGDGAAALAATGVLVVVGSGGTFDCAVVAITVAAGAAGAAAAAYPRKDRVRKKAEHDAERTRCSSSAGSVESGMKEKDPKKRSRSALDNSARPDS